MENVISFDRYKENKSYDGAVLDRKRLFLRMLGSLRVKSIKETRKNIFLSIIGLQVYTKDIDNELFKGNPIIFGMSDKEFAILRSILDGDYSLLGFEKLSSDDQKKFLMKCIKIFNEEGKISLNAYISYCKRKCENYGINNFGDA